jgi:hypothetical protein
MSSRSGTSSSSSTTARRTGRSSPCPTSTSTPAWASSASSGILNGVDPTTTPTCSRPSSGRSSASPARAATRGKFGAEDDGIDTAYRVLADHVRTLSFALTDGAVPGNEGRGYVLRRILRRAVRFGRQTLGAEPGFVQQARPVVVEHHGRGVPGAEARPAAGDRHDLRRGRELRPHARPGHHAVRRGRRGRGRPGGTISGADAFKLYDTYGFPVDLTMQMAEERGMSVDVKGFEAAMEAQKARSRAGAKTGGEAGIVLDAEAIAGLRHMQCQGDQGRRQVPRARDPRDRPRDLGRQELRRVGGHHHRGHDRVGVILDKTNFYAEMGGQVADTGMISRLPRGPLGVGQKPAATGASSSSRTPRPSAASCSTSGASRRARSAWATPSSAPSTGPAAAVAANHTATHLLNLGPQARPGLQRSTRRARSSTTPSSASTSARAARSPPSNSGRQNDREATRSSDGPAGARRPRGTLQGPVDQRAARRVRGGLPRPRPRRLDRRKGRGSRRGPRRTTQWASP